MPAAPETAVFGAAIRPITGGPNTPCSAEGCPGFADWYVVEEHGDDDYGYYACDEDVADMARAVIEDGATAGD